MAGVGILGSQTRYTSNRGARFEPDESVFRGRVGWCQLQYCELRNQCTRTLGPYQRFNTPQGANHWSFGFPRIPLYFCLPRYFWGSHAIFGAPNLPRYFKDRALDWKSENQWLCVSEHCTNAGLKYSSKMTLEVVGGAALIAH